MRRYFGCPLHRVKECGAVSEKALSRVKLVELVTVSVRSLRFYVKVATDVLSCTYT